MIEEVWDAICDFFSYIFSFEWIGDIGEMFSSGIEALTDIGDSPMTNIWFWVFYVCLMAGVWILPSKMGLADYKLWEKLMYTVLFFIIDWFVVQHFRS
ncbi:MAG: hypothetical protein ACOC3Z_02015 [Nanoarchaeota archaeon]